MNIPRKCRRKPTENGDKNPERYHYPEEMMTFGERSIVFINASVLSQKTCPPGRKLPMHYGFNHITSGSVEFRYNTHERYTLQAGDLIAILPNDSFELDGDSFRYQFVSFNGNGSAEFLTDIGLVRKKRMVRNVPVQIRTLMNQIIKAGMENRTNPCFFLSRLFGIGDIVHQINRRPVRKEKPSYPELIKRIAEQKDYQHLSLADIAVELNVCADTLRKACLKQLHMPANAYLAQIKLARAKELLVNTSYKMACISDAAGFGSEKHFFKTFKLNTGKTPLEWRHSESSSLPSSKAS